MTPKAITFFLFDKYAQSLVVVDLAQLVLNAFTPYTPERVTRNSGQEYQISAALQANRVAALCKTITSKQEQSEKWTEHRTIIRGGRVNGCLTTKQYHLLYTPTLKFTEDIDARMVCGICEIPIEQHRASAICNRSSSAVLLLAKLEMHPHIANRHPSCELLPN